MTDNLEKKIEIVKRELGVMKVEPIENGYYVRYRKSKKNKINMETLFGEMKVIAEEDLGAKRIGEYEFTMEEKGFEYIYDNYMSRLFARER